jgi:hypothetical protein
MTAMLCDRQTGKLLTSLGARRVACWRPPRRAARHRAAERGLAMPSSREEEESRTDVPGRRALGPPVCRS